MFYGKKHKIYNVRYSRRKSQVKLKDKPLRCINQNTLTKYVGINRYYRQKQIRKYLMNNKTYKKNEKLTVKK